jgi:hypothetical protein
MRSLNILATYNELQNLFPEANLISVNVIEIEKHHKIVINNGGEEIEIHHYIQNPYNILNNLKSFDGITTFDLLYSNPIDNLIIVVDRKIWSEFYLPLMKKNPIEFDRLEKLYVERNTKVLFNFAFLEANEYEIDEKYFRYDFKFNHIKMTDYELFNEGKNFHYDSFYCMFHLMAEGQFTHFLFPHHTSGKSPYNVNFSDVFKNLNITHNTEKPYVYSSQALKPRFHRVQFLLKAKEFDILKTGLNCINEKFLLEYTQAISEGYIYTDHTKTHTDNHIKYFTKENFNKLQSIRNEINVTPLNAPFEYDHLLYYFKDKEYDSSYFEVVGETHCIFNLKYGFFTEKSIKPVLSEKFELIYGSNKVYEEYNRIGIDLFLDDFNLQGIQTKNELEQIDMIVDFLKNKNQNDVKNLFIEKTPILRENKQKLITHYCNIMNNINKLL